MLHRALQGACHRASPRKGGRHQRRLARARTADHRRALACTQLRGEAHDGGRQARAVDDGNVDEAYGALVRPVGGGRVGGEHARGLLRQREVLEQPLERREVCTRLRGEDA